MCIKNSINFMNILPCKPPLIYYINLFFLVIKYPGEDREHFGSSTNKIIVSKKKILKSNQK